MTGLGSILKAEPWAEVPRDKNGKWTRIAYIQGTGWKSIEHVLNPEQKERLRTTGVPPAWTNAIFNLDKNAKVYAKGRDVKGRVQPRYNPHTTAQNKNAKFERVKDFHKTAYKPIMRKADSLMQDGSVPQAQRDLGAVVHLMGRTGFRIGGSETGADEQAYGASTLQKRHIKVDGNKIRFTFVGKSAKDQDKTITDHLMASYLTKKLPSLKNTQEVFTTSADKTLAFIKEVSGNPKFLNKDFRTWHGTGLALALRKKMPIPKTMKEYKDRRNTIGDAVAAHLGNSRNMALGSYIAPFVFDKWPKELAPVPKVKNPPVKKEEFDFLDDPYQEIQDALDEVQDESPDGPKVNWEEFPDDPPNGDSDEYGNLIPGSVQSTSLAEVLKGGDLFEAPPFEQRIGGFEHILKTNPYHEPPGSSIGGQFAKAPGQSSFPKEIPLDGPAMSQIKQAVDRGVFDFTVDSAPKNNWDNQYTLTITPKQIPEGWKKTAKGSYYDPEFGYETEYGRMGLKDTTDTQPPGSMEEGFIYRGMSYEEYQNIQRTGEVKSMGDYNLGDEQVGLTYYSKDNTQSAAYASGFAPWQFAATPDRPAVMIKVRDPGNHVAVEGTGVNEVGLRERVKADQIVEVYYGKVIGFHPGWQQINVDKNYDGKVIKTYPASSTGYTAVIAWEKQKVKKFNPNHEPAGSPKGGQFAPKVSVGDVASLADRLSEPDSGFTYNPRDKTEPKEGFALSIYPGRSAAFEGLKPVDLAKYVRENMDLLKKEGTHLGAWRDPDSGKVFLDISKVVNSAEEAHDLSLKYDQLAYFDLVAGKSVQVNPNATSGGIVGKQDHEQSTIEFAKILRTTIGGPSDLDRPLQESDGEGLHPGRDRGDEEGARGFKGILKGTSEGASKAWSKRLSNDLPDTAQLRGLYNEDIALMGENSAKVMNHALGLQYYKLREAKGQDHHLTKDAYADWQKSKDILQSKYGYTKNQIGELSLSQKNKAAAMMEAKKNKALEVAGQESTLADMTAKLSPHLQAHVDKVKTELNDFDVNQAKLAELHSANEAQNKILSKTKIGTKDGIKSAHLKEMKAIQEYGKYSDEAKAALALVKYNIEEGAAQGLTKGQMSALKAHATMAFKGIEFGKKAGTGLNKPVGGLKPKKTKESEVPLTGKPLDLPDSDFEEVEKHEWGKAEPILEKMEALSKQTWLKLSSAERHAVHTHVGTGFKKGNKALAQGKKGISNLDSALDHPLGMNLKLRRNMPQRWFFKAFGLDSEWKSTMDSISQKKLDALVGRVYREKAVSSTTWDLDHSIGFSTEAHKTGRMKLMIRAGPAARGLAITNSSSGSGGEQEVTLKKGATYVIRKITKLNDSGSYSYSVDVDLIGHTP